MKPDARRTAVLLSDPGSLRTVLLHGEDSGVIRERADLLVRAVAGSLDDAFRVATLERDQHGRLAEETRALSLVGGRRAIRVREVTDALLPSLRRSLEVAGDTLLVLEAPGLGRGRLRSFVEAMADGAAIPCYAEEGRTLEDSIRALLLERAVSVDPAALDWLSRQLGANRDSTRSELEKLALYVGPGGVADLRAAQDCVGDAALLSVDAALFAATAGELAVMDRALERALAEGVSAIAVLRPLLSHLQRLHQARLLVEEGTPTADAARALRPPVFFRRLTAFTRAVSLWEGPALLSAIEATTRTEAACKETGSRPELLCRRLLWELTRQAAQARGGPLSRP